MPKKKTHTDFVAEQAIKHPDIDILGEYVNSSTKIAVKHKTCGYQWSILPASLQRGYGCPKCGHSIKKDHSDFLQEMQQITPTIKILGTYQKSTVPIECECKICECHWSGLPSNLLRGHGCPGCSSKLVVPGYNDIATTSPAIVKFLKDKNDAYKYTSMSHSRIDFVCPDCGQVRNLIIKSVTKQGFSCTRCGDGISFPNKYARGLLSQLPVQTLIHEYAPQWAQGKMYDNYFEYNNLKYVLEMDGAFHFKDNFMSGQTKEESKEIDLLKDQLAESHGINIIRINCITSNTEHIQKNILSSTLSDIFDLKKVDWKYCEHIAASNLAKTICDFYEKHKLSMSKQEMAKYFSIGIQTLRRYINNGYKFGWLNSTPEDKLLRSIHTNHPKSRHVQVIDIKTNMKLYDFKSVNLCAKTLSLIYNEKISASSIKHAIKCKNGIYHELQFIT